MFTFSRRQSKRLILPLLFLYAEYAGESGKNEFKKEKDIVARQITYLSKIDNVRGYYIFSYSSLKDNEETSNVYSAMQNSSQ